MAAADPQGQHTLTTPYDSPAHSATPVANPGRQNVLKQEDGATLFDATALPASTGTWRRSAIIDTRRWRRLVLIAKYTPGAASTNGKPVVVPFASNETGVAQGATAAPSKDGDVWAPFCVWDSVVAAQAGFGAGAFATTTIQTAASPWGLVTLRRLAFTTDPANATTNVNLDRWVLDVTDVRHVQLQAAELGDAAHPGTLRLYYALTA